MSDNLKYFAQTQLDEHDKASLTKKVSLWGWDADNLTPVRLSVNSDGEIFVQDVPNKVLIDEASSTITYIGETKPGTYGLNVTTNNIEIYNGSAWRILIQTSEIV